MNRNSVGVHINSDRNVETICVCGAARSGTSMIAGILRQLGVDMGEDHLDFDTNEDTRFLSHNGIRDVFNDKQTTNDYLDDIRPLIKDHNNKPLSGWKDPLSSYYIGDLYKDVLNLGVIFVARDPVSIALGELRFRQDASMSTDFDNFLGGINFVNEEYQLLSSFLSTFKGKCLILSYEKALLHKEQLLADIAAFLGVEIKDEIRGQLIDYISPEANTGIIDDGPSMQNHRIT